MTNFVRQKSGQQLRYQFSSSNLSCYLHAVCPTQKWFRKQHGLNGEFIREIRYLWASFLELLSQSSEAVLAPEILTIYSSRKTVKLSIRIGVTWHCSQGQTAYTLSIETKRNLLCWMFVPSFDPSPQIVCFHSVSRAFRYFLLLLFIV